VEPAATNLALQSENFLTTWSPTNITVTTGSTAAFTAPDGTTSADLFTESTDVSATNHQISQSISTAVVSGTSYTLSCFFKATAANRSARLSLSSALFSGSPQAFFDITSGIVGTTTDCTARIENYGSGWYRCIMTAICDAAGTASVFVSSASGNTRDYIGNGSASLYLWGAQLETGSVATSYIPTTAGTGSRSGDLVSVTGAVSGSIGQTAGTFYLDLTYSLRLTSTATRWIQIFGSSNNIGLAVATTNIVRSIVNGQSDILSTPSTADGVKIAWGYDGSGVVCFVNGTQYTLTNGGAQIITQLNQISLDLSTTNAIGNCRLRAVALYTTRLTNDELDTLTTL
jgi:hypothetical protein